MKATTKSKLLMIAELAIEKSEWVVALTQLEAWQIILSIQVREALSRKPNCTQSGPSTSNLGIPHLWYNVVLL